MGQSDGPTNWTVRWTNQLDSQMDQPIRQSDGPTNWTVRWTSQLDSQMDQPIAQSDGLANWTGIHEEINVLDSRCNVSCETFPFKTIQLFWPILCYKFGLPKCIVHTVNMFYTCHKRKTFGARISTKPV